MEAIAKLTSAISKLEPNSAYAVRTHPDVVNEEVFNNIEWHTETALTWDIVKAKMDEVDAEYDAQDYARKRQDEYPTVQELVVALYDTEDKAAIDAKRAEIKLKYPKPVA
jgi:HD superfamily phosphohydrolase YqeK